MKNPERITAKERGLITRLEMAKRVNVPIATFHLYLRLGLIPRPTQVHKSRLYYCPSDVQGLQEWFGNRDNYKRQAGRPRR